VNNLSKDEKEYLEKYRAQICLGSVATFWGASRQDEMTIDEYIVDKRENNTTDKNDKNFDDITINRVFVEFAKQIIILGLDKFLNYYFTSFRHHINDAKALKENILKMADSPLFSVITILNSLIDEQKRVTKTNKKRRKYHNTLKELVNHPIFKELWGSKELNRIHFKIEKKSFGKKSVNAMQQNFLLNSFRLNSRSKDTAMGYCRENVIKPIPKSLIQIIGLFAATKFDVESKPVQSKYCSP